MTSTSLNTVQINQPAVQQSQPLVLKQGQVFHGTIKKLYPDQMAEVQIGQNKLFAKLETPLKAGDSHFFQVTNMNPQAELKVVTGPMQASQSMSQQINQLIDTMNLPKTTEMQQVVAQLIKNQSPISREQLVQAESWLKNLPESITKKEALQVIQKMVDSKLPFTNEVFKGMVLGAKTNGISQAISNFANLLNQDQNISPTLKSNIQQQLQLISKPLDSEQGGLLLAKATQMLNDASTPINDKASALNLLKATNIVSKDSNENNWLTNSFQQLKNGKAEVGEQTAGRIVQSILQSKAENLPKALNEIQSFIKNEQLLTNDQKNNLLQLVNRFESVPKNSTTIEQFGKILHEQLVKDFSENASNNVFKSNGNELTMKNQLSSLLKPESAINQQNTLLNLVKVANESPEKVIQNMVTQANSEMQSSIDGKAMEQALKTVLKGLGMSYEAALNSKNADVQELAQSLKPQLLSLIQDEQTSVGVKEAAENIVGRLNGMQLQSGENGHQHQIVMQIPLNFLGKNTEGSIQWNGRMKDDGKIDSNFARVLFYLDMESLEETVVDMQVQNRIISINIYNDTPELEILAGPLKNALKKGLIEKNYQLSGLFFKNFEKSSAQKMTGISGNQKLSSQKQSGVDIRV